MPNPKFSWKALCLALAVPMVAHAQQTTIDKQVASDKAAAASQERINNLDDKKQEAFQRYRAALARAESLEIYNRQLARLVESQEGEISSIKRQTEEIETIETGALPLMIEMTDVLTKLVEADVPFLIQERLDRVENLKSMIDRADVTVGEKYRRIMEAYMVEAEYGRTIEAYSGELAEDGSSRTVSFLRFGRVGLFYQTLDGSETGRWNSAENHWEKLSGSGYRKTVRDGLRVARKQAPPSLLTLPFNTPEAN
ncbi:conserved hypothetical protein [Teredinibacter turnerae T7901]|uniref:TonB system biopolymer transport component n=1 Tax=Teredinibacter turnerae (strain ATCC 39867 / T7901) TaxID=377629 RepID=C5BIP4_TERTT|nr:DUF3450 domain-containing protein [Teredinibacter turnerae]ACR10887.1 conserved hypothetical protein [Teredinibacter turnerae T7901]